METPDWVQATRRAKLWLILLVLAFLISIPYLMEYLSVTYQLAGTFWAFFSNPLVKDIRGAALSGTLAALLLSLFLTKEEHTMFGRELDQALNRFSESILKRLIQEVSSAPTLLEVLGHRSAPAQLFRSALTVHLEDEQLAQRAYENVLAPFISQPGIVRNQTTNIKLFEATTRVAGQALQDFFVATIVMKYSQRIARPRFVIRCSSSYDDFLTYLADPACHFSWSIPYVGAVFPRPTKAVFEVKRVEIDGVQGRIKHNYLAKYEVDADGFEKFAGDDKFHEVFLEFETLLKKREHVLFLAAERPTYNWTVSFDFSEAHIDFESVYAIDNLVSTERPKYTYTPSEDKPSAIVVSVSDWVLPKGGVIFVWALPHEVHRNA